MGCSRTIAVVMAALLVGGPALADTAAESKDRQHAQALVKLAIGKSQAKEHAAAIELYLQAYKLVPLASLLSNVGTEYRQDKQPREALTYFCKYLEQEPSGPLAGYATTQATELEAELGDDDTSAVCKPAAPTPEVPLPDAPRETPSPMPPPRDPGRAYKFAGLTMGAFGVANLGLGFFFGARASSYEHEINNWPANHTSWDGFEATQDAGRRAEKLQVTFLITGGVFVATGVTLYFVGRAKSARGPVYSIAPTLSPTSSGLAISGRF